jgi:hypothetical protein
LDYEDSFFAAGAFGSDAFGFSVRPLPRLSSSSRRRSSSGFGFFASGPPHGGEVVGRRGAILRRGQVLVDQRDVFQGSSISTGETVHSRTLAQARRPAPAPTAE